LTSVSGCEILSGAKIKEPGMILLAVWL
jgi:hypothetical protein